MDGKGGGNPHPFRADIERWRDFGGGFDSYGNLVTKPAELTNAEMILGLCDRFHKLPSEIENEDAELLSLIAITQLAQPSESSYDEQGMEMDFDV